MLEIKGATGSTNKGPYEYQQDFNDLTNLNAKKPGGQRSMAMRWDREKEQGK